MKSALFPTGILLLFFTITYSQTPKTNIELADSYSEYFNLNRERVFLHLNKNNLVPNEELWFSAYVFDTRNMLPNFKTTNLLLDIFNSLGKHVETKTIYINAGKGTGYLQLDPKNYQEGKYFIKASTAYMRNFKEDLGYLGRFTILGTKQEKVERSSFDLQILPEGGHLLINQKNTIGVKLIDATGNGVRFYRGRIIDQTGTLITSFKSNRFGMGKFNFTPKSGNSYSLIVVEENGIELQKKLPPADLKGMNLATSLLKDNLIISIRTNTNSLPEIENNLYTLAIHQEGKIKQFQFTFPENKRIVPVRIPKDSLYPGVNILTIFNEEFQPLLERQIFNNDLAQLKIKASLSQNSVDSLEIALKSETENFPLNSMSISVLPANTKSIDAAHNILSAFYLRPFLKGEIEQARYYFSDQIDLRRREYDIDLLLLNQGWSKYSWNDIFYHPPEEKNKAEIGFTIRGQVTEKQDLNGENLLILSEESGLFEVVKIRDENYFEAKNIFLLDSASVAIGLPKGKNNRIIKPKLYAQVKVNRPQPFLKEENLKFIPVTTTFDEKQHDSWQYLDNFITQGESLDTVNLKGSSKTKQQIREMLDPSGRTDYIDDLTKRRYLYLTQYLRSKGFKVLRNIGGNELYIINKRFGQSFSNNTFTGLQRVPRQPVIILNGTRLKEYSILDQMMMSDVESVYINKVGAGEVGILNIAGIIKIKTKTGRDLKNTVPEETTYKLLSEYGYAPTKEYYAPKYKSYSNSDFENYGAIQWFDDISLSKDGFAKIKVLNTMQSQINLYIEGMTVKGELISETITLKTNNKKDF